MRPAPASPPARPCIRVQRHGRPRAALAVRSLRVHVRQHAGPPLAALCVRGEGRLGYFPGGGDGTLAVNAVVAPGRAMTPQAGGRYAMG